MHFKCFICEKLFNKLNEVIKHLKEFHKIKDNTENLQCVVNKLSGCRNTFLTFNGLKKHVNGCVIKNQDQINGSHKVFLILFFETII